MLDCCWDGRNVQIIPENKISRYQRNEKLEKETPGLQR
jgi:hypothetical protein